MNLCFMQETNVVNLISTTRYSRSSDGTLFFTSTLSITLTTLAKASGICRMIFAV